MAGKQTNPEELESRLVEIAEERGWIDTEIDDLTSRRKALDQEQRQIERILGRVLKPEDFIRRRKPTGKEEDVFLSEGFLPERMSFDD